MNPRVFVGSSREALDVELENVIGNAAMMVEGDVIDIHHFPPYLHSPVTRIHILNNDNELLSMGEMQRQHLLRVLERFKEEFVGFVGVTWITPNHVVDLRIMDCHNRVSTQHFCCHTV